MSKIKRNIASDSKSRSFFTVSLIISLIFLLWGIVTVCMVFTKGLAFLDINNVIFWGVIITNFVFWIGIGHAGTFISAILLLLRQNWRHHINRPAEAMTIVAIVIAALLPVVHLGVPGWFYKLLPLPDKTGYFFVNFISPLSWDFYAILSYLVISLIFFHTGMLPDLARLRDISTQKSTGRFYHYLSLGWTGSVSQWQGHAKTMYLLAAIATPLVISVHSIVSLDFAVTLNPGWHSTVFPLYFVIGALISGFAMVYLLTIFLEKINKPNESIFYQGSRENINLIILITSVLLGFIFIQELFFSLTSQAERFNFLSKFSGNKYLLYFFMLCSTILLPQLYWLKKIRKDERISAIINCLLLLGMWFERFFIVIGSAERKFLTETWFDYQLGFWVFGIIAGTIGLFGVMILVIIRIFPMKQNWEGLSAKNEKEAFK